MVPPHSRNSTKGKKNTIQSIGHAVGGLLNRGRRHKESIVIFVLQSCCCCCCKPKLDVLCVLNLDKSPNRATKHAKMFFFTVLLGYFMVVFSVSHNLHGTHLHLDLPQFPQPKKCLIAASSLVQQSRVMLCFHMKTLRTQEMNPGHVQSKVKSVQPKIYRGRGGKTKDGQCFSIKPRGWCPSPAEETPPLCCLVPPQGCFPWLRSVGPKVLTDKNPRTKSYVQK